MLDALYVNRLKQTMSDIRANPNHWDQSQWHCGTNHCFAGFAEVRAKLSTLTIEEALQKPTKYHSASLDADIINEKYFGLTSPGWQTLTNGSNTLDQLAFIIDNLIENNGKIVIKYRNYPPIEDFSSMNLNYADLSYSNFDYANFKNTYLVEAKLDYSSFKHANLKAIEAKSATIRNANFDNANLDYADIDYADMSNSSFKNTSMRGTSTYQTIMDNTVS